LQATLFDESRRRAQLELILVPGTGGATASPMPAHARIIVEGFEERMAEAERA